MRINEFIPKTIMFEEKNVHTEKETNNFLGLFKEQLNSINEKQIQSEKSTEAFIKGEDIDIYEVTISAEEAKMSIELAIQIRNKIVEAYQELNRMQL